MSTLMNTGRSAHARRHTPPKHHHGRGGLSSAIALLGALMVGCAAGPDYIPPKAQLGPFHHLDAVQVAGRTAPEFDHWWGGFGDPVLERIVQRALEQNLDLEAAFARVGQARAAAAAAGAQLLPTVDAAATATVERQSLVSTLGAVERTVPGFTRTQRDYNVGAAASWEIDLSGGLRRAKAQYRALAQAAAAEQVGTRISVAADAADAYLQVRGYQARLAVARDQVATDERLLTQVHVRHRAGVSDDREVAQVEALVQQARATVPTLRAALEAELNRLDVLMGAQPGTYAKELSAPGAIPDVPPIGGSTEPLEVLRRRPDVIAAERRLAASSEGIGVALSEYYPKISLAGVLGVDGLSGDHLFTGQAFQPLGSGTLRWRLFDFGKVSAEVANARGGHALALAQYRDTVLKAAEDVENALVALAQTQLRERELQAEVTSLTRARDLSQTAYEAGEIPLTDVLDADRQLLTARDDLDAGRADAARAAVRTFRALGGGWPVAPGPDLASRR